MAKKETVEEKAERLSQSTPRVPPIRPEDMLSTGCTQLNMAFSGFPVGGIPKGTYLYIIGDSGAMKTWLTYSIMAEAVRNKHFADYRLIYDGPENGALFDIPKYFGPGVLDQIEVLNSETVQQFYYHIDDALKHRRPCIYFQDSMDALNADEDEQKFEEQKRAHEAGKETTGTYGMAKAKVNSRNINRVVQKLKRTGSILVVISQTRDKVGGMIPGLKTRGGGRALKFYTHLEAWTSIRSKLTRTKRGKEREYGDLIQIDVQKNRVCGWEGKLFVPFIKGYGIDDVGGMIDYLVDERHWTKPDKSKRGKNTSDDEDDGKTFAAPEFDYEGKKEGLVKLVEDAGDEWKLQKLVAQVWREIEDATRPVRKPRYT